MTSKTTTKATSPKTSRKSSQQSQENSRKHSLKHSVKHSVKKPNQINRQRRLQKQLQVLLLERHSRRCIICHHPEREAIEEEFVHWRAPWKLSQDYKLADYRTVYRHALDAFVESVDDVTFTGDTILRAMRAYSCIDSHGRWTEIPTQVQFSTSSDAHPPQSPPRTSNVASDVIDIDPDDESEEEENTLEERVTASDVLNVVRKYANQASRSDATFCAASPAQAVIVPDFDDADSDEESEEESEENAENALEEFVTSLSTESDGEDDSDDDPNDDNDPKNKSDAESLEETTACAASPAQASPRGFVRGHNPNHRSPSDRTGCAAPTAQALPRDSVRGQNLNDRSPSDRTDCAASSAQPVSGVRLNSNYRGRGTTATSCAALPAQALPRDVVRGQNPNDRSLSDRTACAALPTQPDVPQKPKPDADGLIWHPHPGYPNQEMSEPDAQGRVMYKIHITPPASQLPSRETDARRAAELIYRSVIKKYGNP